jgi:hypothetical protein
VTGGAAPLSITVNGSDASVADDGTFYSVVNDITIGSVTVAVTVTDATGATVEQTVTGRRLDDATAQALLCTAPQTGNMFLHDDAGRLTTVVALATDSRNCGCSKHACPTVAGASPACIQGVCMALVPDPGGGAGGQLVNVQADPFNCALPGHACPALPNSTSTCTDGVCGVTCDNPFTLAPEGCVNLMTDPRNCAYVGGKCDGDPGVATCVQGVCGSARIPSVTAINDAQFPTAVFAAPIWSDLVIQGADLENVTAVEFEDWGPDTNDGTPGGVPSVPVFTGTVYPFSFPSPSQSEVYTPLDSMYGDVGDSRVIRSPASLRMLGYELQSWATWEHFYYPDDGSGVWQGDVLVPYPPPPPARHWYKLRLHYSDSPGHDTYFTVDAPFSFDASSPIDLPTPTLTDFDALVTIGSAAYDPATGFIAFGQIVNPWAGPKLSSCTLPTPRPQYVLAYDAAQTVHPILRWVCDDANTIGFFIQKGLVREDVTPVLVNDEATNPYVTLGVPYSALDPEAMGLPIDGATDAAYLCAGQGYGVVARGSQLYNDGPVYLSASPGVHISAPLMWMYETPWQLLDGSDALFAAPGIGYWDVNAFHGVVFLGDRLIARGLYCYSDSYIEFASARGTVMTPRPVQWGLISAWVPYPVATLEVPPSPPAPSSGGNNPPSPPSPPTLPTAPPCNGACGGLTNG